MTERPFHGPVTRVLIRKPVSVGRNPKVVAQAWCDGRMASEVDVEDMGRYMDVGYGQHIVIRPADEVGLTDWFPPGINPVHLGDYDATALYPAFADQRVRLYWDGGRWLREKGGRAAPAEFQFYWRGLAHPPA